MPAPSRFATGLPPIEYSVDVHDLVLDGDRPDDEFQLEATLDNERAWALAQFLKRAGFSDFRAKAVDDAEAYTMLDAANKVRTALAEAGFEPR